MLMANWSINRLVEPKLMELFGSRIDELLPDRDINDFALNWDAAANQCVLYICRATSDWYRDGAALHADALTAIARILATEARVSLNPIAPVLDCVLPNGFRLHVVLPPASDGPSAVLRTHHPRDWKLDYFGLTDEQRAIITTAVIEQQTIVVAGAMGCGKTSFINALLPLIPQRERCDVIQDQPELRIPDGRNFICRYVTPEMDLRQHVIAALRDAADRILIGEVRGPEAADFLEAASTGHSGLCSIHAGDTAESLSRLQRLAKCDHELIRQAIDLVIQLQRMPDGQRAVTQITALKEGAI
jgi:pilus assembly protein CpaF